jgi:glutamine amidotransferase-like uncharacterized protein
MSVAVKIGVYAGAGTYSGCVSAAKRHAGERWGHEVIELCAADIQAGMAQELELDVIVFPGGGGEKQGRGLEEAGREAVRAFVGAGGGYLGLCAGAFLATESRPDYIHLLPLKRLSPWRRGSNFVALERNPTSDGATRVLPSPRAPMYYCNGPILAPTREDHGLDVWATFASEVDEELERELPSERKMIGKWAIVAGRFWEGRVLLYSPHPELTVDGGYSADVVLRSSVDWLCGEDSI